jgi:hypothetical protein
MKTICFIVGILVLMASVSAGGYSPIVPDPADNITAEQATLTAGAMVDFRGSYTPINMYSRPTPTHHRETCDEYIERIRAQETELRKIYPDLETFPLVCP